MLGRKRYPLVLDAERCSLQLACWLRQDRLSDAILNAA